MGYVPEPLNRSTRAASWRERITATILLALIFAAIAAYSGFLALGLLAWAFR